MDKISRRQFFRAAGIGATALASVAAAGGTRRLLIQASSGQEPGVVLAASAMPESWVKTTCALCPSGCGLQVRVVNGRAVKVEGNPLHPVNQGVCCLKAHASLEMLYSPERLQHPRLQIGGKGSGKWREISWDEALAQVAGKLSDLRAAGQAHTVALLHGPTRGQTRALLGRFMAAFGSPNLINTESPDEQAARLAMLLTQGVNTLPVYDLNNARYAIAFGGNLLESSRHMMTYLASAAFMHRGRPDRGKLVAIQPRLSVTGAKADEWVPIRPGTYGALALGMAYVMINSGLYDKDFVRDYTFGFDDFTDAAGRQHQGFKSMVLQRYPLDRVSAITGVPAADIARLAGEFATNRPAVALLPCEPRGLDGAHDIGTTMAIHALNALAGSIDVPGGVMVQRYPRLAPWPESAADVVAGPGLSHPPLLDAAGPASLPAVAAARDLPERMLAGQPYSLSAVFLYNTNPVFEAPQGGRFAEALLNTPFVVSFASVLDESTVHADLVLPAGSFLESFGDDYVEGTGFAGIALRQPVVAPMQDTREPVDVILDLAARLGGSVAQALPWRSYQEVVDYRLKDSDVDAARLAENGVWSELVYFNAQPGSRAWGDVVGRDRVNAPRDGRFDFFARELLAGLASPEDTNPHGNNPQDLLCLPHFEPPADAAAGQETGYSLLLVSQNLITSSHNWQGIVPSLEECYGLQANMRWASWVEINPRTAEALDVRDGDPVWVESPVGRVQARVRVYAGLWPNAVFLPPGQGHLSRAAWGFGDVAGETIGVNANRLLATGGVTRVRIDKA